MMDYKEAKKCMRDGMMVTSVKMNADQEEDRHSGNVDWIFCQYNLNGEHRLIAYNNEGLVGGSTYKEEFKHEQYDDWEIVEKEFGLRLMEEDTARKIKHLQNMLFCHEQMKEIEEWNKNNNGL